MAGFRKKPFRKFRLRTQTFAATAKHGARIGLVSSRKLVSKGRSITSGMEASTGSTKNAKALVAKPKVTQQGRKLRGAP